MPYEFKDIVIKNIDKNGNDLLPLLSFDPFTTPASIDQMAIGNRIRLIIRVDATGADTFSGRTLTVNLGLFTDLQLPFLNIYGYASQYLNTTPLNGFFNTGNISQTNNLPKQNLFSKFYCDATFTTATAEIDLYITMDVLQYINEQLSLTNNDRFIDSRHDNTPQFSLTNYLTSVYTSPKQLGIIANVQNFSIPVNETVLNPNDGSMFWNIEHTGRWYNSNYLGATGGMRYLRDIEIECPSQISNLLPSVTKATATSSQSALQSIDASFNVLRNKLAVNENNTVRIYLRGNSSIIAPNPAITDIRALMFCTDNASNTANFFTDLKMSDAVIPQATPGSAVIDNMIYTPSDWYENVPNPDDIYIEFTINGNLLQFGSSYRIIINVYDNANPFRITSHISPELSATYVEPVIPNIDGYLSTYNAEFIGNDLTLSPHQRVKASLVIDKTSYDTQLAGLGLAGSFDSAFFGLSCNFVGIGSVINQVQTYIPNTLTPPLNNEILTPNMVVVTNDPTTLRVEATFRVDEEYAGNTGYIDWSVNFNQPTFLVGQTEFNTVTFQQKLQVDLFDNDQITPNLINVRFLDYNLYPGTKVDVIDFCNRDKVIVEVEKDNAYTGSINLIATIYPGSASGNTTMPQVEEEESWQPTVVRMPLLNAGELSNVETGFLGDDFATYEINLQQIPFNQQYWISAISLKTDPDYCPVGLVDDTKISTQFGTLVRWKVLADITDVVNEILTHPNYVGGLNIVRYRVVNSSNVLVGISQVISGYNLTVLNINNLLYNKVIFQLIIDAVFDYGFGTHTIRHELNVNIAQPFPLLNPAPIIPYDSNAYICTDLG